MCFFFQQSFAYGRHGNTTTVSAIKRHHLIQVWILKKMQLLMIKELQQQPGIVVEIKKIKKT